MPYHIMLTSMDKRKLITLLGFALSIFFLYLSLRGIQIDDVWQTLKRADARFIFLALLCIGSAVCGASFRWARVAGTSVQFRETFTALLIGLFINNVLPARIGELARGYALSRKRNSSFTYALSTVMADRFFDLTGLLFRKKDKGQKQKACQVKEAICHDCRKSVGKRRAFLS